MRSLRNKSTLRSRLSVAGLLTFGLLIGTFVWVGATAARQQPVSVVITDSGINLSSATVPHGAVRFNVRNNATVPYDLEIEGPGIDLEKKAIQPASDYSATLDLSAGKYEIKAESESGPKREWKANLAVQ